MCVARTSAAADGLVIPHVGIDDDLQGPPVKAPDWRSVSAALGNAPIAVRLVIHRSDLEAGDQLSFTALDGRLASYGPAVRVWLVFGDPPVAAGPDEIAAWRQYVRAVVGHTRGRVQAVELPLNGWPDVGADAFLLKATAVQARAEDPAILIGVSGPSVSNADRLARLYATDIAPYVDLVITSAEGGPAAAAPLSTLLDRVDPSARIAQAGLVLPPDAERARRMILSSQFTAFGTPVALTTISRPSSGVVNNALSSLGMVKDLLSAEIVPLDASAAKLTTDPADALDARLVYNLSNFSTYLLYQRRSGSGNVAVTLHLASLGTPMVRSLSSGLVAPPRSITHDASDAQLVTVTVPADATPRILDFNYGAADIYAQRDETRATAQLTVQEIIARHQQVQAAEDDLLETYTADARMEQHFRPTVADAGYDVVSDTRIYRDRQDMEWEELSFSVNGTRWGSDRPAFPLLQAEKVLSLPLDIRLTNDYRYRLTGTDTVGGRRCYAVAFDPVDEKRSLYKGTVWIDAERFTRARLQTVQTRLSSPIVSNEEVQVFEPVKDTAGHDIWLPARIDSKQIVLIAGRNLLVEKAVVFSDYRLNTTDFTERRQSARSSDRIMYRETDAGLRHYVKEHGTRVVSDTVTTRAKAMAMGVTIDPSFDFPLPIFGINYLDFGVHDKNTQLAVLFGGVLVLANLQHTKVFGGPLDASVDLFAIAVPSNDRVYGDTGERESERLITWPLNVGGNLGWQMNDFHKLTANYQFRFDGYHADTTTADDFVIPQSTITNGIGAGYEFRRFGYSFTANGTWYGRVGWKDWGVGGTEEPRSTYAKYSVNLSKDFYWNAFNKLHLNGAWFGGDNLDRFTQYQFGLFDDTRIHGVPSSGIRFAELGMIRGSYSFNVFDQYRFDLFLEHAAGHRGKGEPLDHITGLGAAFSLRTPWRTILRADVGKSFLPDAFAGTGSVVVQVLLLKPL